MEAWEVCPSCIWAIAAQVLRYFRKFCYDFLFFKYEFWTCYSLMFGGLSQVVLGGPRGGTEGFEGLMDYSKDPPAFGWKIIVYIGTVISWATVYYYRFSK